MLSGVIQGSVIDLLLFLIFIKQDIDGVQQVQRCFSNHQHGMKNHTYQNRLKHLNLPSLELRHNDLAVGTIAYQ